MKTIEEIKKELEIEKEQKKEKAKEMAIGCRDALIRCFLDGLEEVNMKTRSFEAEYKQFPEVFEEFDIVYTEKAKYFWQSDESYYTITLRVGNISIV